MTTGRLPDSELRAELWRVAEERGFAVRTGKGTLELTGEAHDLIEQWSAVMVEADRLPKPGVEGGQLAAMEWLAAEVGEETVVVTSLLHLRALLWKWELDREAAEKRMSR